MTSRSSPCARACVCASLPLPSAATRMRWKLEVVLERLDDVADSERPRERVGRRAEAVDAVCVELVQARELEDAPKAEEIGNVALR